MKLIGYLRKMNGGTQNNLKLPEPTQDPGLTKSVTQVLERKFIMLMIGTLFQTMHKNLHPLVDSTDPKVKGA